MGRKISISTRERLDEAMSYLQRAHQRDSSTFFARPGQAGPELARLKQLMTSQKDVDITGVFSVWMDSHLTELGRARLLATLRRKHADSSPARRKRHSILVPAELFLELKRLSKSVGDMPLQTLLDSLVAVASVDKQLQEKIARLAAATKLR